MSYASSRHITKLKQSIFAFRYLWVEWANEPSCMWQFFFQKSSNFGNKTQLLIRILKTDSNLKDLTENTVVMETTARHNNQHNVTQHNDTKHNDIQHK
jgi:hypothetical protein